MDKDLCGLNIFPFSRAWRVQPTSPGSTAAPWRSSRDRPLPRCSSRTLTTLTCRSVCLTVAGSNAMAVWLLFQQVIYDVSHNIAKMEEHMVDGRPKTLLVHRKGSTRAFPPHHPLISVDYQVGRKWISYGMLSNSILFPQCNNDQFYSLSSMFPHGS